MKKLIFSTLVGSLLALAGCQQNEEIMDNSNTNGEKVTVTANIKGSTNGRVALTPDTEEIEGTGTVPIVKVDWRDDENNPETFQVIDEDITVSQTFTQVSGSTFTGTMPEGAEYALYNYEVDAVYHTMNHDLSTQDGTLNEDYVYMYAVFNPADSPLNINFIHETFILKPTFTIDGTEVNNKTISEIVIGNLYVGSVKSTDPTLKETTVTPSSLDDIYIFIMGFSSYYKKDVELTFEVTAGGKEYTGTYTLTNENGLTAGNLYTATIALTQVKTCTLQTGSTFNSNLSSKIGDATSIVFEANSSKTLNEDQKIGEAYYDYNSSTKVFTIFTDAPEIRLPQSCSKMFQGLTTIESIDFGDNINSSAVTSMSMMFSGCTLLSSIKGLSELNTSAVQYMNQMFYNCAALTTLDLSAFDTKKVTTMKSMFSGCKALNTLNVSNFNTEKVQDMEAMFNNCTALTTLNLSNFDTKEVTKMTNMFLGCSALTSLNVSNFVTTNVTDMSGMFYNCKVLPTLTITNFDTQNVTTMYTMFGNCKALTSLNLSNFNTAKVSSMIRMFEYCESLKTLNVSNFDTGEVKSMNSMFYYCKALTELDLSSFNFNKVTDFQNMLLNVATNTTASKPINVYLDSQATYNTLRRKNTNINNDYAKFVVKQ